MFIVSLISRHFAFSPPLLDMNMHEHEECPYMRYPYTSSRKKDDDDDDTHDGYCRVILVSCLSEQRVSSGFFSWYSPPYPSRDYVCMRRREVCTSSSEETRSERSLRHYHHHHFVYSVSSTNKTSSVAVSCLFLQNKKKRGRWLWWEGDLVFSQHHHFIRVWRRRSLCLKHLVSVDRTFSCLLRLTKESYMFIWPERQDISLDCN